MSGIASWLKRRKVTVGIVTAAALVAVPVGIAVAHEGFPVADVELSAKDVWVTNGGDLLAGRLNRQIEELESSVSAQSTDIDVVQSGEVAFLHDRSASTLERIDPAFATLTDRSDLPGDAALSLGGTRLSVLDPATGALWITDASGRLSFSAIDTPALRTLGTNAQAVTAASGAVFAVSAEKRELYTYPADGGEPSTRSLPALDDYELSAAGNEPVILDRDTNTITAGAGAPIELPTKGVRVQQPSATGGEAVVATAYSLLRVPLGGGAVSETDAGLTNPVTAAKAVVQPVNLNGCAHGAWSDANRYLAVCGDKDPVRSEISPLSAGAPLVFRVNRDVIALNNVLSGDVWLVESDMRLVTNWEEVTPPEEEDGEEGDQKSATQSFEDTIAERTEQNRPPIARDDDIGVRPGRTTVLSPLDNDTDPDGDVLTIVNTTPIPEDWGSIEPIDGGRALQFEPAEGRESGTLSFRYTVSDGRPGGIAEAQVNLTVVPLTENSPPEQERGGAASVEAGQSTSYNVLTDWRDPDGDDIFLESASSEFGDDVRFTPDGFVTVTHTSPQMGVRDITVVVSDGRAQAKGSFTVDVQPAGSLNPIGTPDFADTFVGQAVTVHPLENDLSPSGEQLSLLGAEAISGGISVTLNPDGASLQVVGGTAGSYYVKYTLGAGSLSSVGLIRVDITDPPEEHRAPVAVRDTGYLRAGEPVTLPVLANDVSPSGAVLAIQNISIPDEARGLSIEVLDSSVIRVSSSEALTEQVQFGYTVSDGSKSASTTVSIVPVPPLSSHQPPIAQDDTAVVRAGDITSIDVLANDTHPDSAVMTIAPELVEQPQAGVAFVSGGTVRYQAPTEAGTYSLVYKVGDAFGQSDVARVVITVVPAGDDAGNRAPNPKPLTARAFAGSTVTLTIPLYGIDPDGDSTVFDGIASPPSLGAVISQTSTTMVYKASAEAAGTDAFTYRVRDSAGEVGTGTIRIGVIPRPDTVLNPTAIDDTVEVRPGRVASIPVLANDSDPNGYPISLSEKLPDVPDGVEARVEGNRVVIDAPEEEGTYSVRYEITNGHGGTDTAFARVKVTQDATILPPTVVDHIVEADDLVGKKTVDVNVREGAGNPNGSVEDLAVSVEGPNADAATVLENGLVRVTLGDTRTAVTFRLTSGADTDEERSAAAFVVVPAFSDGLPPRIKPGLPEQIIDEGGTRTWALDDIAESPTGKAIRITGANGVSNTRGDGSSFVDEKTLTFTPTDGYRGAASISFEVSDDSPGGTATLVLPLTIGDPEMKDLPPSFTPPQITVEAGENPQTIDLRSNASHPNPEVLKQLSFGGLAGAGGGIEAGLSGSNLTVSAPFGTRPGTSATVRFTVSFGDFSIEGSANVRVVSSTRELASPVDDVVNDVRPGETVMVPVLANDTNPFPGEKLTLVDAVLESGSADVSVSGDQVRVRAGQVKSQQISVVYTVGDRTGDAKREVKARATVVVTDVPDQPAPPGVSTSSRKMTVTISNAPATNGSEITEYQVRSDDGRTQQASGPGQSVSFDVENGVEHSFTVVAVNGVGPSAESAPSQKVASYGTPGEIPAVSVEKTSEWAPATARISWQRPTDDGGRIDRYEWKMRGEGDGSARGTSDTSAGLSDLGPGRYAVDVRACGEGCGPWKTSNEITVETKPKVPEVIAVQGYDRATREGISDTWKIQFTLRDWDGQHIRAVAQYCQYSRSGAPMWGDISGTVWDYDVTQQTQTFKTGTWVREGSETECGVRIRWTDTATSGAFDLETGSPR